MGLSGLGCRVLCLKYGAGVQGQSSLGDWALIEGDLPVFGPLSLTDMVSSLLLEGFRK